MSKATATIVISGTPMSSNDRVQRRPSGRPLQRELVGRPQPLIRSATAPSLRRVVTAPGREL